MQDGYLLLETHPAHPGLVRLRASDATSGIPATAPRPGEGDRDAIAALRYAASFNDIDAALMHFHDGLRGCLVDLNARLYRTSIGEAIAAAEAIELGHRRLYIDPDLADDPDIAARIARLRRRNALRDRVFTGIGVAAVTLWVLTSLLRL